MSFKYHWRKFRFYFFGRPVARGGETSKAKQRRVQEGFFEKYCNGVGLDVGYGGDLLASNCVGFDYEHGDAQYLKKIKDNSFNFVYSSHTLEHMINPGIALKNWWRVIKPGGFLILFVPDRNLYEKKPNLPSKWNKDHKHFFLLDRDEPPDTIGVTPLVERTLVNAKIVEAKRCDAGCTINDPDLPSEGEYSIEVVVEKLKSD